MYMQYLILMIAKCVYSSSGGESVGGGGGGSGTLLEDTCTETESIISNRRGMWGLYSLYYNGIVYCYVCECCSLRRPYSLFVIIIYLHS